VAVVEVDVAVDDVGAGGAAGPPGLDPIESGAPGARPGTSGPAVAGSEVPAETEDGGGRPSRRIGCRPAEPFTDVRDPACGIVDPGEVDPRDTDGEGEPTLEPGRAWLVTRWTGSPPPEALRPPELVKRNVAKRRAADPAAATVSLLLRALLPGPFRTRGPATVAPVTE